MIGSVSRLIIRDTPSSHPSGSVTSSAAIWRRAKRSFFSADQGTPVSASLVYPCLPFFTLFTLIYPCLPLFTLILPLFTLIYPYFTLILPLFTHIYRNVFLDLCARRVHCGLRLSVVQDASIGRNTTSPVVGVPWRLWGGRRPNHCAATSWQPTQDCQSGAASGWRFHVSYNTHDTDAHSQFAYSALPYSLLSSLVVTVWIDTTQSY